MTALLQQQAAITRRARRLHVGNLPPGLTGEALKELFNTTMQAAKLAHDEQPCVNDVHMAADNKFGFVEFRSAAECSNALALDGMQLLGKPLRVARPNDYAPPPVELLNAIIPPSISATVTSSNLPQAPGITGMALGGMGNLSSGMAPVNSLMGTQAAAGLHGTRSGAEGVGCAVGCPPSATLCPAVPGALGSIPLVALTVAGLPTPTTGGVLAGVTSPLQNLQALTRRARRLHIGNLPIGVGLTADMLKQFFNAALVSAALHDTSMPGDPVMDAMLGSEGKFGFVEFRTVAEATSCMALNNIELGGKQLRVERPRDYAPMPESMHDELRKAGYLGTTSLAPDGKDLLSAQPPPAAAGNMPMTTSTTAAAGEAGVPPLDVSSPTTVLVLANMMTAAESESPSEMAEILDDTKVECEQHGKVVAVLAPKLGAGGEPGGVVDPVAIGLNVFVRFETTAAAVACAKELHGKHFDGRTVTAAFAEESTMLALSELPCYRDA